MSYQVVRMHGRDWELLTLLEDAADYQVWEAREENGSIGQLFIPYGRFVSVR